MNDEFDKIEISSQLNERRDVYILRKFNSLNHTFRREVAYDSESVWSVHDELFSVIFTNSYINDYDCVFHHSVSEIINFEKCKI